MNFILGIALNFVANLVAFAIALPFIVLGFLYATAVEGFQSGRLLFEML